MPTQEQKFRFLKRVYFGVSDNPEDDVNPFQALEEFAEARVGDMSWGEDNEVRERCKLRFSFNYHNVLNNLKIELSIEDIFSNLKDDRTNNEVIEVWTDLAEFK